MSLFEFFTSPLMAVYFISALFGGTLILLQLLLMLVGLGGGSDVENDFGDAMEHASPLDIFKIISLRTVIAGIAFFGLGGLAGLTGTGSAPISVGIAVLSGLSALFAVYYLYWSTARIKSDGSLSDSTLIGCKGNVYLRIPAAKDGAGKVLIEQQGRTVEYEAITAGGELKSNQPVVVVGIVSSTTVEVQPQ